MTAPVVIIGNVVADIEPRISQAGKPWCSIRVASTPRERDRQSGEYKDGESMFVSIPLFGEYADHAVQSLTKGTRIVAVGKLRQRSYTDHQGAERSTLEMYDVDAIGPDLRFATAQVAKARQGGSGATNSAGMGNWSGAPENGPQSGAQGGGFDDGFEQPF